MRVQETNDIPMLLLALQDPLAVEVHTGSFALDGLLAAAKPDAAAALAEQRPALLDDRHQRRGCACQ
jgi:hypothetical protein